MAGPETNRRLRFELAKNEIFQLVEEHFYEAEDIWWSPDEFARIKMETRQESKEWRRHGFSILLQDSFESPRQDVQECLNAFCQLEGDFTRRGLERQLSRQHGEERSDVKDRSRTSVLLHQRRLKREGLKLGQIMEQVAHVYRDASRPAKAFARRLGKADRAVVDEGESNTPAEKIRDAYEKSLKSRTMDRRMSDFSAKTAPSINSFDSRRKVPTTSSSRKQRCPNSPATPKDEFYAAIA